MPARRSNEIVARALAASNVGTWEWRIADDVLRCDSAAAAMLGMPLARTPVGATYRLFVDRLHPQDRPRIGSLIDELRRNGGLYVARYRTVPAPGTVRSILARGRFALDADGIVSEARGIVIDVTDGASDRAGTEAAFRVTDAGDHGLDGVAELALALWAACERLEPHRFARLKPLMDSVLHEIGRQLVDMPALQAADGVH